MHLGRIIGSISVLIAGVFLNMAWSPMAMLMSGEIAGRQFEASDTAFLTTVYPIQLIGGITHAISLMIGVAVLLIWWKPLRQWVTAIIAATVILVAVAPPPASAFWATTDATEAYTVLPNQSAFWIPNIGNNKDNQAQFNSEDYLNANKVAAKLFIIPHVKFTGSGGTSILSGWDYFVPTGRLILVDRTPYSREWVKSAARGSSKSDDSFPCQSKEGLNITVGVSIGTSVTETNAAKFLYNFGVKSPPGNLNDPQVIFTSVYYGRSLAEVMDDVIRKKVQTLVCGEITARTFDQANADANKIMGDVTKAANDYLASVGISLNFIGWADTFEFDHNVQDAINRRYIAQQDQAIASALQPFAPTIQAIAVASAIRAWGDHADGKFPTTVVGFPPDLRGLLGSLLQGPSAAPAK